ncbi:hypothetical protein LTR08_005585 [Meristemomyces frigidus]|nr:hypothetical protein LTR08_005585 [Meristemomyces frigidus]
MLTPRLHRPLLSSTTATTPHTPQTRHASLLRRPRRPYTFTQLLTLSDGSTFTHRTTSPAPLYRSTKDTKNSALWNPSSQRLLNIEEDEAGRLRRFRKRFGRGFDVEGAVEGGEGETTPTNDAPNPNSGEQSLLDLIAGYSQSATAAAAQKKKKVETTAVAGGGAGAPAKPEAKKTGKGKK